MRSPAVQDDQEPLSTMDIDQDRAPNGAEEDDDEVVREIDVFVSPELAPQMYLLQYPLQHTSVPTPVAARIKPRHGMLQEDHQVPGVQSIEQEGMYFMDTRTYDSQTIPVSTHLCIAKLVANDKQDEDDENSMNKSTADDALHLVPLTHISQMRPSFGHIDEDDDHRDGDDSTNKRDADEGTPEKKPVIFQRKESERAAMARKSSYAFKRTSENTEEWVELSVHGDVDDDDVDDMMMDDSNMASSARANVLQKVKCPAEARSASVVANDSEKDYVQSLNYLSVVATKKDGDVNVDATGSAAADVKSITRRMTVLLQSGSPIPFSILRAQFDAATIPDDVLFQALNSCALLCRGNWCLHSKFLTSSTSLSAPLRRLRTFLLLLLQEKGIVHRSRLARVYAITTDGNNSEANSSKNSKSSITPDMMLASLKLVGKRTHGNNNSTEISGWVLKVDDDTAFLDKHRDLQKLHEAYWTRQRQRFRNELRVYNGQ